MRINKSGDAARGCYEGPALHPQSSAIREALPPRPGERPRSLKITATPPPFPQLELRPFYTLPGLHPPEVLQTTLVSSFSTQCTERWRQMGKVTQHRAGGAMTGAQGRGFPWPSSPKPGGPGSRVSTPASHAPPPRPWTVLRTWEPQERGKRQTLEGTDSIHTKCRARPMSLLCLESGRRSPWAGSRGLGTFSFLIWVD